MHLGLNRNDGRTEQITRMHREEMKVDRSSRPCQSLPVRRRLRSGLVESNIGAVVVIRRQARVMATHSAAGPSTTQIMSQSSQIQTNVTKTMILVSGSYSSSRLPTCCLRIPYIILYYITCTTCRFQVNVDTA